jgi:hypothetical protein
MVELLPSKVKKKARGKAWPPPGSHSTEASPTGQVGGWAKGHSALTKASAKTRATSTRAQLPFATTSHSFFQRAPFLTLKSSQGTPASQGTVPGAETVWCTSPPSLFLLGAGGTGQKGVARDTTEQTARLQQLKATQPCPCNSGMDTLPCVSVTKYLP